MLLFKKFGKVLRWGNFGMLYMNLVSLAQESGHQLALPPYVAWEYLENPPLLDNGFSVDLEYNLTSVGIAYSKEARQKIIKFFEENQGKNINIVLSPHLQSVLWHEGDEELVRRAMKIKQESLDSTKLKYLPMFSKPTICLGIRRGDFVNHQTFYQIPLSWFMEALDKFFPTWKLDYNVIVLSDNINEVKQLLPKSPNFFFAEPNKSFDTTIQENYYSNPFDHFLLGLLCDHCIISHSTFHWLVGWYVGAKEGSKVIHSNRCLTGIGMKSFWNPDFYPLEWISFDETLEEAEFPLGGPVSRELRKWELLTDKENPNSHSYGGVYDRFLGKRPPKRLLEVGVWYGGSLQAWSALWPHAEIVGVDIEPSRDSRPLPPNVTFLKCDAYKTETIAALKAQFGVFDAVIDDGIHTYESFTFACKEFQTLLCKGGLLILEDIPNIDWCKDFEKLLHGFKCTVFDMRVPRNRWDNIILVAEKQ